MNWRIIQTEKGEKQKMEFRKKAALVACSDPLPEERLQEIRFLRQRLLEEDLEVKMVEGFFGGKASGPERKAKLLTDCFRNRDIAYIFDVSGGDLANFVLPYLDYTVIQNSEALFFGYSDLTTVINAIIAKAGRPAVNYQIRNLLYEHAQEQLRYFHENVLTRQFDPQDLCVDFLRGTGMKGRVIGGNIRCFLKLAGTEYWPDMEGSILLLESLGGGVYQMMTALEQYRQIGVFNQIEGVLLGTFTKMEQEQLSPTIEELVLAIVPENIPVAKTRYIGHHTDARALMLGKEYRIGK